VPPKKIETKTDASGTIVVTTQQKVRVWMQVVVTLAVLATCFLIITAPNRP
jgi:hypothetical protein